MLKYLLKEVGDFWKAQFQTLQETYSKTYEFSDILLNEIYIRLHTRSKDGEIVNDVSLNDAGKLVFFIMRRSVVFIHEMELLIYIYCPNKH